jgi:hypothetical protein
MKTITEEGLYSVSAITGCDTLLVQYAVNTRDISVLFDPDVYEIRIGDSVQLSPQVVNEGTSITYQWFVPEGGFVPCATC